MVKRQLMRGNPWDRARWWPGDELRDTLVSRKEPVTAPSLFLRSCFSGRPAHLTQTFDTLANRQGILRSVPKSPRHRLVALVACAHRDKNGDPLFACIDDLPFKPLRPRSEEHTSELQSHHDLVC